VEQFPRRIAEVEERLAVFVNDEPFVLRNFQPRRGGLRAAETKRERDEELQWLHQPGVLSDPFAARTGL